MCPILTPLPLPLHCYTIERHTHLTANHAGLELGVQSKIIAFIALCDYNLKIISNRPTSVLTVSTFYFHNLEIFMPIFKNRPMPRLFLKNLNVLRDLLSTCYF